MLKRGVIALAFAIAVSARAAPSQDPSMENAVRTRISAAAAQTGGWHVADVKVKPNEDLDRGGCTFLLAYNTKAVDAFPLNYALLPDGRIAGVDLTGMAAATALLRDCGKDADANWWAAVVTRFSGKAGGTPLTADSFASQIDVVRKAGIAFKPPTLTRTHGTTRLEFFSLGVAMPIGTYIPYHIVATLPQQGELTVAVSRLQPGSAH